jgi:soluble lytic murein transglycosylase-like protein
MRERLLCKVVAIFNCNHLLNGANQMNVIIRMILIGLALASGQVLADSRVEVDSCMAKAATLHHVDLSLLRAIAKVESNMNPKAVGNNTNGTSDTGLMQINDWWLPTLAKHGIKKSDLLDACTSAYVGAWILARSIQQHGNTWRAVGAYNSPTPKNQQIYADKVNKALAQRP